MHNSGSHSAQGRHFRTTVPTIVLNPFSTYISQTDIFLFFSFLILSSLILRFPGTPVKMICQTRRTVTRTQTHFRPLASWRVGCLLIFILSYSNATMRRPEKVLMQLAFLKWNSLLRMLFLDNIFATRPIFSSYRRYRKRFG